MAVTATALGAAHGGGGGPSTNPITTGVSVPAGALVVFVAVWTDSTGVTPSSISGGSLTWTQDLLATSTLFDAHQGVAIYSAPAPAGLASGTDLQLTFGTNMSWGCNVAAFYLTGVDTSSTRTTGTASGDFAGPGISAWSSPSITTAVDAAVIGIGWEDGSNATSTPTSPYTELTDDNDPANNWSLTTLWHEYTAAGTYTPSGTFSVSWGYGTATAVIAYKAASSGAQTVSVTGKGTAAAFGAATPRPGGVARAVSGKTSAAAFGAVGVHTTITKAIPGKGSAAAFGVVTPAPGNVNVPVTGKGTAASFGGLTLDIAFFIAGLGSAAAFGAVNASTSGGAQNVPVTGRGSAAAFGSLTPAPGGINVAVAGRGSAAAFGSAPRVNQRFAIPGRGSAAAFGAVSVGSGGVVVPISGLGSAANFGAVTFDGGAAPTFNPAVHGGRHR